MSVKDVAAATALFAAAVATPAYASNFSFDFNGAGVSGSVQLTYSANPNTGAPLDQSPNTFDPIGSYIVTGISGSFSDTTLGITNAAITGIVPSNPANPHADNLLAPHSFGFYTIANGVPSPEGTAPGLSYDNLFYPGGSPGVASDYPFGGGFVDIYGLVFTIEVGNAVNFWSNGVPPGAMLSYGAAVTDGTNLLHYANGVTTSVPEPASWAMMIGGFGMIGASMRGRRRLRAA